jgi:hypothetical protein
MDFLIYFSRTPPCNAYPYLAPAIDVSSIRFKCTIRDKSTFTKESVDISCSVRPLQLNPRCSNVATKTRLRGKINMTKTAVFVVIVSLWTKYAMINSTTTIAMVSAVYCHAKPRTKIKHMKMDKLYNTGEHVSFYWKTKLLQTSGCSIIK